MNGDIKFSDNKIEPQSEFAKKLDNFWYYNKWKVIAAVFIAVALTVCIVQCATREKNDIVVIFAGAYQSYNAGITDIKAAFDEVEPETVGKLGVGFNALEIYSDEYVKAHPAVNGQINSANFQNFTQLLEAGEQSLVIADSWIYDAIKDRIKLRKVSEFATLDEAALYDECAVKFKKTAFFEKYSDAFDELPDDAVIFLCDYSIFRQYTGCSGGRDKNYEKAEILFETILNFKVS